MIYRRLSIACFALGVWLSIGGHSRLACVQIHTTPANDRSAPAAEEPTGRDAETVQATVEDILSAPEYRHLVKPKTPENESKLPRWLERFLDWLFGDGNAEVRVPDLSLAGFLIRGFMYLVAITILALVVVLIVRSILQHLPDRSIKQAAAHGDGALAPSTPPGELPADEYVRRAMEYSRAGDHRAAVRQLLLGTMSWIERAGLIRFRKGLTNRDYLRAIWRRPTCRDSMAAIADAFDRVYFGRRTATAEVFERCLEQYQTGFTGQEAVGQASA
jgi:hypothetical protein